MVPYWVPPILYMLLQKNVQDENNDPGHLTEG